jgi:predicted GIY-YIG superfamily endonuclease
VQIANHNVLYRFYSSTGQLLYTGITMNPPARFASHREKDWWTMVSGITVEHYDDRDQLIKAERRAIQIEHPVYNVVHNSKRKLQIVAQNQVEQASYDATARCVDRDDIRRALNRLKIEYRCDACKRPVIGNTGYVHIVSADIQHCRKAWDEFKRRKTSETPDGAYAIWGGAELAALPGPAPWRVHHLGCDPDPDGDDYYHEISEVNTYPKLLSFTAHLLGKDWLCDTNWSQFLYSILHAQQPDTRRMAF